MPERAFSVAIPEVTDRDLCAHLLRSDGQEDLCFALYRPSTGALRSTALVVETLRPHDGERHVHGNASFTGDFVHRAIGAARTAGCGLAFLHSHPQAHGWQSLSRDDEIAETRIAGAVLGATSLPLVGLTRSNDAWSARIWPRTAPKTYRRIDAQNVRIVGKRLAISWPFATVRFSEELACTSSVWGMDAQNTLSNMVIGVAGLGSVGSAVAEALARMGVTNVVAVDFDRMERRNFDRQLNSERSDIGVAKVEIARRAYMRHAAEVPVNFRAVPLGCDETAGYSALLDCDVVFACVDRPWPRRMLNELAYTALIPVINGGIRVRKRRDVFVGADWHVHTAGPGRRCLQCWGAFDPSDAALDRDGLLDDPSYVAQLAADHPVRSRDNVFPFALHVAAMEAMQLAAMVAGPVSNLGDQNYHFSTGTIDSTRDIGCHADCSYAGITGFGDASIPPMRQRNGSFEATPASTVVAANAGTTPT